MLVRATLCFLSHRLLELRMHAEQCQAVVAV